MENRVLRLARGQYAIEGNMCNAAHNLNWRNPYGTAVWHEGYGALQIAAGVTLIGEDGVVLSGTTLAMRMTRPGRRCRPRA